MPRNKKYLVFMEITLGDKWNDAPPLASNHFGMSMLSVLTTANCWSGGGPERPFIEDVKVLYEGPLTEGGDT